MLNEIKVLDHGYVKLLNLSGPTRRANEPYDAADVDPAQTARMSFDAQDPNRSIEDDIKLVKYLLTNKHTTPIEMIECWFEMQMPIFVARQLVRHRTVSINEMSGRYTKLPDAFYIPDIAQVGSKSKSNKQGRDRGEMDEESTLSAAKYVRNLKRQCRNAYEVYELSLNDGIPPELARMVLPLNIYTKWVWKMDLHNMMHFLRLRMHEHAQFESQQYANAAFTLLDNNLPEIMHLFKESL